MRAKPPKNWQCRDVAIAEIESSPSPVGGSRRFFSISAVVEIGFLLGLAVIYNFVRAGGGAAHEVAGKAHADDIVHAEGWFFDKVELGLNHWIAGVTVLAVFACYFYALMHYLMTPVVLLVSRKKGGWKYWRGYWALVLACAIALVSYANFPLAPPRLMPGVGAIDVMREFSEFGWWGDAASAPRGLGDATNQYAAMPSLHFGWSLWCGIQMWGFGSKKWKVAAVTYPALQAIVVVATANHFGLDVLGGAICVLLAYGIVTLVGRALGKTGPKARAKAEAVETPAPLEDVAA